MQVRHSVNQNQVPEQPTGYPNSGNGVPYVKQVASKGATGRKGSLPLSYQQVPTQVQNGQQIPGGGQSQVMYTNNQGNLHRSSQPSIQTREQLEQAHAIANGNGKGINKTVKSHAKYFSQQNSPVGKDGKAVFNHNPQQSLVPGASGIILSSSGAGIIGVDNHNRGGHTTNEINQTSHHTTGNFGSNQSKNIHMHQATEPRMGKNYSQLSQHSNGSNIRDYKHNQYLQQLLNQEGAQIKHTQPMHQTNSSKLGNMASNTSHMKQVHSLAGPILSQYAGNQTIASNGNSAHSNYTQNTTHQTFNASMNKHFKANKQQYDDNYLNGPLNQTQTNQNPHAQHQNIQNAKRAMNSNSQQLNHQNIEDQLRLDHMGQPHHKRVVSNQVSHIHQQQQQAPIQRSSTQTGNYNNGAQIQAQMNQTDSNYNQKRQSAQRQQKVVQTGSNKLMMEKSQELFQKSGNQLNFLNSNNIILNAQGERALAKNMKNKQKAQTRPNSNQKNKQLQGSFIDENTMIQHFQNENGIKSKNAKISMVQSAQTSVNDRKAKRYTESQGQPKRQNPQNIILSQNQHTIGKYGHVQQIYPPEQQSQSTQNMIVGNQNLVYFGGNHNSGKVQNEMHANPSHGNIPMISSVPVQHSSQSRGNKGQQVVTVPQTMLHKSNKLMNNYLKQSTIQQPEQLQSNANPQMFNKRMSTDQIIHASEKEQLSFSMKKQSFHQRAETQLKNPNTGFGPQQQYEIMLKDSETIGSNVQGVGSASNSFLAMSQHHNSLQNVIISQASLQNANMYNIQSNTNMKFNNSKSQKSSTSRLINSNGPGKFVHQKQNSQQIQNQVQNSADRIAISQRTDQQIMGIESNHQHQNSVNVNEINYGGQKINVVSGAITSSSSKQLMKNGAGKNSKLNTLSNPQYPYQSSSTKSNKNIQNIQQNKNNLSIAQIFQQKGLNYKGPSKLGLQNQNNANANKMAQRMGPNGVIVHTKGALGIKGSLTTSANTAQNSPRSMVNKGMYAKNQPQINLSSIRKKPSTASIAGASMGISSQHTKKNSISGQKIPQQMDQNMRTTSHGGAFKKVHQSKSGLNSRLESPLLYQDEMEVTEIHNFDNTERLNMLEPNRIGYNQQEPQGMISVANQQKRQKMKHSVVGQNAMGQKQLIIGTQPSSQYIADNGGTGSNPSHHHQKAVSQHDFYSQNIQPGQMSIPQKKNQHSNSLGNMQQLELLKQKHMMIPTGLLSNPHPTPIEKQQKIGHGSQGYFQNNPNRKSKVMEEEKFEYRNDEEEYQRHLQQAMLDEENQIQGPMITEEEEHDIRQIASDINEKAFYGKILRAKQIISNPGKGDSNLKKLSPRSQEIAHVMKEVAVSFKKQGHPPDTHLNYYRVGKMLGRGAFGKVNLAMHKLVRKLVALKSLNKECLTDEVQKLKLMKEVNLLLKMRHDHVVKIYETIETKKHIIIVMELCAGGDLLNYVRKRRRLKEPFAKKIFKQIIEGLQYIHAKFVGHRDIKLDNILLDGKGQVKIADFGVSKQCSPGVKMREQCGTPAYIAPEILKNKNGYGFGVDIWSAGVVLFAMLYGTVPFKAASMEELHSLILRGVYTLKEDISQEARDMLRGLLEINPHKRLTIPQILSHPWLNDYDETLQLFNDQERDMIKKEYTYNDPSRYNRNENEEPVDCFTEHNIDSVYNTLKNVSEKSIILAPFNSTQSEDFQDFKKRIKPMMLDKQLVIRLSRLCREVDRQYEFNNNGQLDNGVYHKQVNNTADGDGSDENKSDGDKKGKKKKKDNSDEEDDESRFQIIQCTKSMGMDFPTEEYIDLRMERKELQKNLLSRMDDLNRLHHSTMGTREMVVDFDKVQKLVQFGYPQEYVVESLQENLPNYLTAGYYLLQMDQNYC